MRETWNSFFSNFEDLAPEAISKRIDLIKPKLFITRFEKRKFKKQIQDKMKSHKKLNFISVNFEKVVHLCERKSLSNEKYFSANKDFFTLLLQVQQEHQKE